VKPVKQFAERTVNATFGLSPLLRSAAVAHLTGLI
jgi:hypothetical protein